MGQFYQTGSSNNTKQERTGSEGSDDLIKSYKEREKNKEIKRKRKFNTGNEQGSFWSLGKV